MPPMALQVPAGGPFEMSPNSTLWLSGSPQMGPAEAARFEAAQRAHPARKRGEAPAVSHWLLQTRRPCGLGGCVVAGRPGPASEREG